MSLRDPESMNVVIGKVLRYGVILSAAAVILGVVQLAIATGYSSVEPFLQYDPSSLPHGTFPVGLAPFFSGLTSFSAYSLIDLGVIILIATPVTRVAVSVLLFAAERDKLYVLVTSIVLALLLFSILVTPFISIFRA